MKRFLLSLVIGWVAAAVVSFLGLILAGAGHGWIAGASISFTSWILFPWTTLSWAFRHRKGAVRSFLYLGIVVVLVDFLILGVTLIFDKEVFPEVVENLSLYLFLWFALWIGWHLSIVIGFLRSRRHKANAL